MAGAIIEYVDIRSTLNSNSSYLGNWFFHIDLDMEQKGQRLNLSYRTPLGQPPPIPIPYFHRRQFHNKYEFPCIRSGREDHSRYPFHKNAL
ncbi:MAG: hypothetical protein ACJAUD_001479 [Crocinitomicaceae bacterium]|jgi:hypothetical protein